MDFSTLEKFLQEQIKVGAKPELLVTPFPLCERDKGKITVIVITAPNLSKWYITIFILRNFQVSDQIYLRKYNLRDWLCVIALNNDKDRSDLFKKLQKKKAFSMMYKERRAATTSLISMYCQTDCKKDVCLVP
ncbi:PREDICTED: 60S ribosomal protein L22-3-like [Brassica oleracea var. oleracea]|uniref:60S ribosomal protein L22-3-like n=1 Tax=Brassica oleracea var. oleracea TaxID=109376 RepID=UPI0006A6CEF4|nr:PREDICTED: 60S ribosomal protein L22-3-like [Brassica oleracea var. oleracea]